VIGGILPLVVAAILAAALPESPRYLARRPHRRRELAAILRRLGHETGEDACFVDSKERQDVPRASVGTLFTADYRRDTVGLWVAFFCCILGIYIVFSWMPSLLAAAGFDIAVASTGLAVFNVGGVLGAIAGAWLMTRFGSRPTMLTTAVLGVLGAVVLVATPLQPADTTRLMVLLFLEGGFNNAVQTNLYALSAQVYPTQVRATGVGATAGVGRSGAIVSSFLGALALASGSASYFGMVAATMALTFVGLAVVRRHTPPITGHAAPVVVAR
jgi:AAHS family 4-hydroxybenzoate transporter-like MFS transporter